MFFAKYFKKNNGYTMIELSLVLTMMVIILATVFINYKTGSSKLALQRAVYKLSGDIRAAQAMAGIKNSSCNHPNYKYGYGINFDTSSNKEYKMFADCNGNYKYQPPDLDVMGTVQIEKGVKICKLYVGGAEVSGKHDLLFLPPDPFVLIDTVRVNSNLTLRICLESDSTQFKDIIVNKIGMVSIQ